MNYVLINEINYKLNDEVGLELSDKSKKWIENSIISKNYKPNCVELNYSNNQLGEEIQITLTDKEGNKLILCALSNSTEFELESIYMLDEVGYYIFDNLDFEIADRTTYDMRFYDNVAFTTVINDKYNKINEALSSNEIDDVTADIRRYKVENEPLKDADFKALWIEPDVVTKHGSIYEAGQDFTRDAQKVVGEKGFTRTRE